MNVFFHHRRGGIAWLLGLALIAGCASPPPPPRLYRLPSSVAGSAAGDAAAVPSSETWQLLTPVALPDYLDRDALLVPEGSTGLQPLEGHRWAEPLRDALPRILRQDLARLLGADRVWAAPVPAGVTITRQLRVELLAFEASADRRAVQLRARWSLLDPRAAATAPLVEQADISATSAGPDADSLVAAHRLALWRLAERISRASPTR